jgi:hypothetical protein
VPAPAVADATVAVNLTACPVVDGLALDVSDVDVATSDTASTVCVRAADVLPAKLALPPYVAVIECVPTPRDAVVNTAVPDVSSDTVPRRVDPSLNVTVPPGVPAPTDVGATVAVNVTDCPACDGFWLEAIDVVVGEVVVGAEVGASRPFASVASGAAVAVLPRSGRPYISSIVRRTL